MKISIEARPIILQFEVLGESGVSGMLVDASAVAGGAGQGRFSIEFDCFTTVLRLFCDCFTTVLRLFCD